jgi:hypothetical protein
MRPCRSGSAAREVVYLEQTRAPSWDLDETGPRPEEVQRNAWRFRPEIEPKLRAELPVTEHLAMMDCYLLTSLSQPRLREIVKAMGDRREARELVTQWLGRAEAQEARVEALREARRRSEAERRALQEEVDAVIRRLEGERQP